MHTHTLYLMFIIQMYNVSQQGLLVGYLDCSQHYKENFAKYIISLQRL